MTLRWFAWITVLAGVLMIAACDGGEGAATESTTTTVGPGSTERSAGSALAVTTTTTRTPDARFNELVAEVRAALARAEGDLCALVKSTSAMAVKPTTRQQTMIATDLVAEMIRAMGRVAEPADADAYDQAADRLQATAEEREYSPEWINGSDPWDALDDPEFLAASERMQARYQRLCPDQAGVG